MMFACSCLGDKLKKQLIFNSKCSRSEKKKQSKKKNNNKNKLVFLIMGSLSSYCSC